MLELDRIDEDRREDEALRRTLLTMNPSLVRGLYPALFDVLDTEDAEPESQEPEGDLDFSQHLSNYDMSGVEWQSPSDVDAAELEFLQQMLQNNMVTVPVETEAGAPEEVEEDFGLIGQSDDAEWT